jgi:hypothetical protein
VSKALHASGKTKEMLGKPKEAQNVKAHVLLEGVRHNSCSKREKVYLLMHQGDGKFG